MHARSAPERICQAHLADQLPNFETHLGPAGSPSRLPAPEGPESSTIPSYDHLRPNDCFSGMIIGGVKLTASNMSARFMVIAYNLS